MKGILAVGTALAIAAPIGGGPERPASTLTSSGRTLWNFEALLHDTGIRHSGWSDYRFVFAGAHKSAFSLVPRNRSLRFGNYPVPIVVHGRMVACDPHRRTYLIEYWDASSFALGCLPPEASYTDVESHPTVPVRVRLTNEGLPVWNFEALLRDTFGKADVCTKGGANYVDGGCGPLSVWFPYFSTFNAGRSAFRLVPATRAIRFRRGDLPMRIKSRFIACDPGARTFLALHQAAFACVTAR